LGKIGRQEEIQMKLMFISDIHGSNYYLDLALEKVTEENPDYLVILGDVLYHGPRNDLPKDYAPKEVLAKLNMLKEKIICVQGNCDSTVDQMVLEFPIMQAYTIILNEGKRIFATHGHLYNLENMPVLSEGDILIHGHTHIPVAEKVNEVYLLNPGSIAIPKEGTPHCYGIIENNEFLIKTLEGEVYKQLSL
jgi:putative phosphoesterase